ncbi:hypothetical protein [Corynebacterium bovis]|uniref:hypothetical protein n=1 Tax=Corynebacterium bovis TaxID=36808 RepID=UPI000F6484B4|nr:hypothetical protein [Corynebacterium bovis]MDN8579272.1 hypothetical protein [Corynebacterium bovis]
MDSTSSTNAPVSGPATGPGSAAELTVTELTGVPGHSAAVAVRWPRWGTVVSATVHAPAVAREAAELARAVIDAHTGAADGASPVAERVAGRVAGRVDAAGPPPVVDIAAAVDAAADTVFHTLGAGVLVAAGPFLAARGPAPAGGWTVDVGGEVVALGPSPAAMATTHPGPVTPPPARSRRDRAAARPVRRRPSPAGGRGRVGATRPFVTVASSTCLAATRSAQALAAMSVQGSGSDPERTAVEAGLVCRFDWGSRVARLGGWPEPAPSDPTPAAGAGETPGTVGAARGAAAVRAGWVA